jgi:AraC-like DNA-binding protein
MDHLEQQKPAALLRERRLCKARELLQRGGADTVAEIAYQVGLTPNYLARAYKARFGVPPSQTLRSP